MKDTAYLDRTEKFVEWLEEKRQEAGMTQEELAEAGGISHSTYSKLVSLRTIRQREGDDGKSVYAPRDPRGWLGVLKVLADRLGPHVRDEGLIAWGHTAPTYTYNAPSRVHHRDAVLGGIYVKLHALHDTDLKVVHDLVHRLLD